MGSDIFDKYPELRDRPRAAAMFCAALRDQGKAADALALGAAAVAAAPSDDTILFEVRAALSHGVAAFHGPMMLDHERNAAYARAIERAVRPGMLVLEIGAGSGLLALLAARAGARVVTCESQPVIAAAAQAIVDRNGFADRVTVVAKRSDAMTIPDDLPEPADLVVHEIFGSQLIDEGVTAALADARRRLLKPGAPSLPPRAAVRCALAATPEPAPTGTLADVHGFDLSAFDLLVQPIAGIRRSRRGGLALRSATATGLRMDYDGPAPFGPASDAIAIASTGGRIDGLAQWIEIEFEGGDRLENDPFVDGPDSSWAAAYYPFAIPIETQRGDIVDVTLRHRGLLLSASAVKRAA